MQTEGRTDGRTDMTELAVALRNFAYVPKNDEGIGDLLAHVFELRL